MGVIRATFGTYENSNRGGYEKLELIENKGRRAVLIAEISAIRLDEQNAGFASRAQRGISSHFWKAPDQSLLWKTRTGPRSFDSASSFTLTYEGLKPEANEGLL